MARVSKTNQENVVEKEMRIDISDSKVHIPESSSLTTENKKDSNANSTTKEKVNTQTNQVNQANQFDMSQIMQMFQTMQSQISDLSQKLSNTQDKLTEAETKAKEAEDRVEQIKANAVQTQSIQYVEQPKSKSDYYLEILANRKTDREVTIVHNRELIGGLSTHIVLTGLTIDFHTMGEERVLSWQQFEECVSKYRKFFEKEIILLAPEFEDLAQRYAVPCLRRANKRVIAREDLRKIGVMNVHELESYYNSLTEEDKAFVCSYWLGKCYEKDPNFYDRYKIETLNRLSNAGIFDNIMVGMNNEFLRRE